MLYIFEVAQAVLPVAVVDNHVFQQDVNPYGNASDLVAVSPGTDNPPPKPR